MKSDDEPSSEQKKSEAPNPSDAARCEEVERTLDDALADSFPASDPVSIVTSQREEAWERRQREREQGHAQARDAEPPADHEPSRSPMP